MAEHAIGTGVAFETLKAAICADAGYAWSWHCNLAMPMIDAGVEARLANQAAARLMQHLFGFDSRTCKEWGSHQGADDPSDSRVLAFIGWLSVDIPELHRVETPRLAASWERFLARSQELRNGQ